MRDTTTIGLDWTGLDSTRLATGKPARQRMKRPRIESLDFYPLRPPQLTA